MGWPLVSCMYRMEDQYDGSHPPYRRLMSKHLTLTRSSHHDRKQHHWWPYRYTLNINTLAILTTWQDRFVNVDHIWLCNLKMTLQCYCNTIWSDFRVCRLHCCWYISYSRGISPSSDLNSELHQHVLRLWISLTFLWEDMSLKKYWLRSWAKYRRFYPIF